MLRYDGIGLRETRDDIISRVDLAVCHRLGYRTDLKHENKSRLKDAPTAAWSTTTCRLADFDVLANGSSRIRRLFIKRSRGIEGSGGDGQGV